MDGKIIKLADPVTVYETKYSQIVLREPRGDVFNRLGPPRVPVYNQSAGSGYFVEQNDTIAAYLKALIDVEDFHTESLLKKLSLVDTLRLREGLFAFFTEAEASIAAMRQEPSSSASK